MHSDEINDSKQNIFNKVSIVGGAAADIDVVVDFIGIYVYANI